MPKFERGDLALTKVQRGEWPAMTCVSIRLFLPAATPVFFGNGVMVSELDCYLCARGNPDEAGEQLEVAPYLPDELMPLSEPPPEETLEQQLERQHGVSA